jgi:hypothetical protein
MYRPRLRKVVGECLTCHCRELLEDVPDVESGRDRDEQGVQRRQAAAMLRLVVAIDRMLQKLEE